MKPATRTCGGMTGWLRTTSTLLRTGLLGIAETREPLVEVDAAMVRHLDVVGAHAKAQHVGNHALAAHVLSAAVRVSDDHDVLDAKLAHGDEQRSHDAAEGVRHFGTLQL